MDQAGYAPDNVQERKVETLHATGKGGEGAYEVTDTRKYKIRGAVSSLEFALGPDVVAEAEAIARAAAEFREHDPAGEAEAVTRDAAQFREHDPVAEAEAIARDAAKREAEATAHVNEYAVEGSTTPYVSLQPQFESTPADPQQAHMESIYEQINQIREQQGQAELPQTDDNFALGA